MHELSRALAIHAFGHGGLFFAADAQTARNSLPFTESIFDTMHRRKIDGGPLSIPATNKLCMFAISTDVPDNPSQCSFLGYLSSCCVQNNNALDMGLFLFLQQPKICPEYHLIIHFSSQNIPQRANFYSSIHHRSALNIIISYLIRPYLD